MSSGAIRPALAPASIDMLHTVIRPSIERLRITSPRYSMTEPIPPPVPSSPMMARITSLAVEPAGRVPSTVTASVPGRCWGSVWVASTCSTSLVPIPNARAPNAPCVLVWLSPHTTVMPGSVSPISGPITCTMPWPGSPIEWSCTPNSAQLARRASTCRRLTGSAMGWSTSAVGTLWSSVATVNSGWRTGLPAFVGARADRRGRRSLRLDAHVRSPPTPPSHPPVGTRRPAFPVGAPCPPLLVDGTACHRSGQGAWSWLPPCQPGQATPPGREGVERPVRVVTNPSFPVRVDGGSPWL